MSELVMPQSFPENDYTPHGYIDNPYHSMVLNRSGVIRSVPPLGFGYWLRTFKGTYGNGCSGHVNYLSLLHLAVAVDELRLTSAEDFKSNGVQLASKYHTKHMTSYDFMCRGLTFSMKYFLARENSLVCRVDVTNTNSTTQSATLHATNIYGLWERGWWGSDGLAVRHENGGNAALSTIWAYGDCFALGSDGEVAAHKATASEDTWKQWLKSNDLNSNDGASSNGPHPTYAVQSYKIDVPANATTTHYISLSRSTNVPFALEELATSLRQAPAMLEHQLDEDEVFWSACPVPQGDWPELWKRGWVYDYETIRMNVREPMGIFDHHWDGMQIHSPRSVLAEAGIDMLMMSYADPDMAADVMFGTFADAPEENVPCVREDGSMNAIAADGHACGTAPSWCFPFIGLSAIHAMTGDDGWIAELYPYLKTYLEWWIENRTDEDGWLHCKCDWESGQDASKRFPNAEGESAETVRTVDVEAGMTHAMHVMARFAVIADMMEDVPYWQKMAEKRSEAVRSMFVDDWFYDVDCRTNEPIKLDYKDVMMLSPLTCGVATHEQIETLRSAFQHFRDNPKMFLEWPSFLLAYSEAAWTARMQLLNAENIMDIADRAYGRTDAREVRMVDSDKPYAWRIPGTANEFWPLGEDDFPGGEAYGWGATLPMFIIRNIVGFREPDVLPLPAETTHQEFWLAPALPKRFLSNGKKYVMANLRYQGVNSSLTYDVVDGDQLKVTLSVETDHPGTIVVVDENEKELASLKLEHTIGELAFDATNGKVYAVRYTPVIKLG